jgi:hypothetical protein
MYGEEEEDILHAILNAYEYDGLLPSDRLESLWVESDLFEDIPVDLRLDLIKMMAADPRFRKLILFQLEAFL